jgi:hypothetical protein
MSLSTDPLRSFFGLFGFYYALQFLSLSDATVITFLTPSVTAVSGAVFLREKLRMAELYSARKCEWHSSITLLNT